MKKQTNSLNHQNDDAPVLAKFGVNQIELKNKDKIRLITEQGAKLDSFTARNKSTSHINHSVYHLLLDPFTINNAYKNLSKNKGSLTEGSEPGTIQGYSHKKALEITKQLKDRTFTPSPVKRIWIPKKPGSKLKRPLGIPTFKDRVVQEALRGILEAIYEPTFREFEKKNPDCTNFGFRPNKRCWDAIEQFKTYGQKVTYVVEGDIKGAYTGVNFKILMGILSQRIKDKNFLNLIEKFLNAGILEQGQYEHSIIGVPQGGILSPLLFNIYMFEFDKFIKYNIINKYKTKQSTNKSKLYQRTLYKCKKAKELYKSLLLIPKNDRDKSKIKEAHKELRMAQMQLLTIPSYDRSEECSLVYTRYADDWILGVAAPLKIVKEIKDMAEEWLKANLELQLSPEKTTITNVRKKFVPFLGYYIYLRSKNRFIKRTRVLTQKDGRPYYQYRRTTSSKFFIVPNKERLYDKLKLIGIVKPGTLYPIGKRPWAALDEFQIVQKYHSIFLGLVGHYIDCNSLAPLNRISYIFQYSCAKTLATRKKITMPQIFTKYGKTLKIVKYIKDIPTPKTIEFMGLTNIRKNYFTVRGPSLTPTFDPFKIRTFWRTTFKLYSLCCVCGSDANIEMHHINSLKNQKKKSNDFNKILIQLSRKQIPVCRPCHVNITNGTYAGKSLKDLFSESLAAL